jgi:hypothetical protein
VVSWHILLHHGRPTHRSWDRISKRLKTKKSGMYYIYWNVLGFLIIYIAYVNFVEQQLLLMAQLAPGQASLLV